MPRRARKQSNIGTYHVVIRGADRQQIFEESYDYRKYLDLLAFYKQECHFEIFAYCLMSNHIHLLIRVSDCTLENIFRRLGTAYAVWFNMKYQRTGYLQQGRYYSEPIDDLESLLKVIHYIHYNPYKAGLEKTPGERYPWNSMREYIAQRDDFVDIQYIILLFGDINNFIAYHQTDSNDEFLDIHKLTTRLPDDVAKQIITEITSCKTVTDFQKLPILHRNRFIHELHDRGVSARQMNRITGISRGIIDRVIAQK